MIEHKSVYLKNMAFHVPSKIVTNQMIIEEQGLKMKDSWIQSRLGIHQRRWAESNETTSDLLVHCLKKMSLTEMPLFLSTISQDYLTPSTSSEVKRKMGWQNHEPALDLSAACAGLIFSLEMAALRAPFGDVIASAAEIRSRFLDLQDRRTVFLFADAACAFHLTTTQVEGPQLVWTHTSTSSVREPEILIRSGGAKHPSTSESILQKDHFIKMVDGVAITETIEIELVKTIQSLLKNRNESVSDYDYFLFHQGNTQLILNVLAQMGVGEEKTHINFGTYGNSSSASVGVALVEAAQLKKIKSGDRVLMVAMGAGYHLGLAGWKW